MSETVTEITSEADYEKAIEQYEKVRRAKNGSDNHHIKMQLRDIITDYESERYGVWTDGFD